MPDLQISRSDIEQLARKLDSLGSHFTQSEWTLLSAVLALATEAIGTTGSAAADPRPPGAGRQAGAAPLASFTPGKDEDDESLVPDKIGRASLHDLVLRSFTPGQDEASGSASGSGPGTGPDPGPDKIGRA